MTTDPGSQQNRPTGANAESSSAPSSTTSRPKGPFSLRPITAKERKDTPWKAAFDIQKVTGKTHPKAICRGCGEDYAATKANIAPHIYFPYPLRGGCAALDYYNPAHMQWVEQNFGKPEQYGVSRGGNKRPASAAAEPSTSQFAFVPTNNEPSDETTSSSTTFLGEPSNKKARTDPFLNQRHDGARKLLYLWMLNKALPFTVFDDPFFKQAMLILDPAFTMPDESTIRRQVVPQMAKTADQQINSFLVQAETITVTTDGWSSLRNESVLNYLAMNSQRESVLLSANEFFESHTAENLYRDFVSGVIDRLTAAAIAYQLQVAVMLHKIAAVVSDSASNVTAMRTLISKNYTWILSLPCTAHQLNLLVGDLLMIALFKQVVTMLITVIKIIRSCHRARALLAQFANERSILLYLPTLTRWYSYESSGDRVLKLKPAIKKVGGRLLGLPSVTSAQREAAMIMVDDRFWQALQAFLEAMRAPAAYTLILESDYATLGDFVFLFVMIAASAKSLTESPSLAEHAAAISATIHKRWRNLFLPSKTAKNMRYSAFLAAFLLHPYYARLALAVDDLYALVYQWLIEYAKSLDLNTDAHSIWNELQRFKEFVRFTQKPEVFKQAPTAFWLDKRRHFPVLGTIAPRLLAIPPSAALSERCWSLFARFLSKYRARLSVDKVSESAKILSVTRLEMARQSHKSKSRRSSSAADFFKALKDSLPKCVRDLLADNDSSDHQPASEPEGGESDSDFELDVGDATGEGAVCIEDDEVMNEEDLPPEVVEDGKEDLELGIDLLAQELAQESELEDNADEEEEGGVPVVLDGIPGQVDASATIESLLSSLVDALSKDTLIVFQ